MRANMLSKMGPQSAVASLPSPSPQIFPSPWRRVNVGPLRFSRLRAWASIPARDRVIDLGKYKGRMLGSLPSAYLKWVSKNLRAGDTEEWAQLADQVLEDPVYRDRIEWEAADKILSGNAARSWSGRSAVAELVEISERFGWDNEDKAGWSKIDFGLLGTSKGGRIPRAGNKISTTLSLKEEEDRKNSGGGGGRRGERRERARRLREKTASATTMEGDGNRETSRPPPPTTTPGTLFPGREALLKKALNPCSRSKLL